jgi:hypothetical protein
VHESVPGLAANRESKSINRYSEPFMSVTVVCECANTFSLKDEYAGMMVKCPRCGAAVRAGATELTPASQADPIFGRNVFLMRQQLRFNERYEITDEQGKAILFVERPRHFLRNLGASLAAIALAIIWVSILISLADAIGTGVLSNVVSIIGMIGFIPIFVVVMMKLAKKRHVTFYTSEDKTVRLLEVIQEKKFEFISATYTVKGADGVVLARFRKNYLYNVIRRKWEIRTPADTVEWLAREDSIILSLVRRIVPFAGLLRTNFIFQPAGSEKIVGEFRRRMTLLDRYVLDLKADPTHAFDRRVAVALGVMLDTGERR